MIAHATNAAFGMYLLAGVIALGVAAVMKGLFLFVRRFRSADPE